VEFGTRHSHEMLMHICETGAMEAMLFTVGVNKDSDIFSTLLFYIKIGK
jgi:hypothetical protein